MSNHLAIATVSATLESLLNAAVMNVAKGSASLNFQVVTGRPEKPEDGKARVTLFLYQVTPNAAWRNADLPTRRAADGTVVQRPQAAFDLHYLVSFAGEESKQVPERLLGIALTILHAQPILSREMIRKLIGTSDYLSTSDLADQVELIRLTPLAMTIDELSKLWSVFFQIPYHLSVAWQASVVLLDMEVPAQQALPVVTRNIAVDPFRRPVIGEVVVEGGAGRPIVPGSRLFVRGQGLGGSAVRVRLGPAELTPESVSDTELTVRLPAPPTSALRTGALGLQVVQPRGVESNAVPVVLRPVVETKPDPGDPNKAQEVDAHLITQGPSEPLAGVKVLEIPVEPLVKKDQRVFLLLTGASKGYTLRELPRDADGDPRFDIREVATGRYAVRVQVDGAESHLEQGSDGTFDRPWLELPIS